MSVVLGEFDVVELPAETVPPPAPAAPPAPPLGAADIERLTAQYLQRELRCHAD